MSTKPKARRSEQRLRDDYDFRGGTRGKYFEQYKKGTNVVLLDADVAAVFKDGGAVNDALRALVAVVDATAAAGARPTGTRPNKSLRKNRRAPRKPKAAPRARGARGE